MKIYFLIRFGHNNQKTSVRETKMLLQNLKTPIQIISKEDVNSHSKDAFLSELQAPFKNMSADMYLVRQKEIEFLKNNLDQSLVQQSNEFWFDYYTGRLDERSKGALISELPKNLQEKIKTIKPTRFRAVSEFNLCSISNNKWSIERVKVAPFSQGEALTNSKDVDYRQAERIFDELPDEYAGHALKDLINHSANMVRADNPDVKEMGLVVHHTDIKAEFNNNALNVATNSPEGIHQDVMDYIVSAFVVERNNIAGGVSTVFGADKITPIFQTTLNEGMGLFQPDKDTDLWHVVSPITALSEHGGNRATVGFDFTIK